MYIIGLLFEKCRAVTRMLGFKVPERGPVTTALVASLPNRSLILRIRIPIHIFAVGGKGLLVREGRVLVVELAATLLLPVESGGAFVLRSSQASNFLICFFSVRGSARNRRGHPYSAPGALTPRRAPPPGSHFRNRRVCSFIDSNILCFVFTHPRRQRCRRDAFSYSLSRRVILMAVVTARKPTVSAFRLFRANRSSGSPAKIKRPGKPMWKDHSVIQRIQGRFCERREANFCEKKKVQVVGGGHELRPQESESGVGELESPTHFVLQATRPPGV